MPQAVWDKDALDDLVEIWSYIARDNEAAADSIVDRIHEICRLLSRSPFIGQAWPELAPGLRGFVVGNYVIFFRPSDDGVQIVRVVHGARDLYSLFNVPPPE
jgi:toxin ParE1/3/4